MSKPVLLVARPAPHLPATLEYLRNEGFHSVISLAQSAPQAVSGPLPRGVTALLLTSQLAVQPGLPDVPAWCVGRQTAQAALQRGLKVVYVGHENAAAMGQAIAALKTLEPQVFLHPHGHHARLEWHELLTACGHKVLAVETYRQQFIATLPKTLSEQLSQTPPTHTLLFSSSGTQHLANLLKQANIPLMGTAVAFSAAVARQAAGQALWPNVLVAAQPTLAAMVQTLKQSANNGQ